MKRFYALCLSIAMLTIGTSFAQTEMLQGGDMELATDWSFSNLNSQVTTTVSWNYITDGPAEGAGGCLNLSAAINGADQTQSNYAIYQSLDLVATKGYDFDGAFKDLSLNLQNAWCEVYIGSEPVNGNDYGDGEGTKIAQFNTWDGGCTGMGVDGTFINDGCIYETYVPEADGTYYIVLKIGNGDWWGSSQAYDILLDELSLLEVAIAPITAFDVDKQTGIVPLTVQFVNNTLIGDSWAWDFGDGETSTEENPSHTYAIAGKYVVSLAATNAIGTTTETKTDYITVNAAVVLPAGEMLYGGNMESVDYWNISSLDGDSVASATWNYTTDAPAGGEGGNLRLTAAVTNATSQYCLWQEVDLKLDSAYNFDAAFKDINGLTNFWCEVYIGTSAPENGQDLGSDVTKIAQFNTWESCTGSAVDGTFVEDGCMENAFSPEKDTTHYFIIKVGVGEWSGAETLSYEVLLDEVSLIETTKIDDETAIEQSFSKSFKLYPNPATSQIQVSFDGNENAELVIFNALGETVIVKSNVTNNEVLSIDQLRGGIYIARLVCNNKVQSRQLVVE